MDQDNAGAAPAGNPPESNAAPDNGSTGGSVEWMSGLSEGNRNFAEKAGWKTLDDAFTSHANLQTKLSETSRMPGKDAKPEDWQKVFESVRPEKPDGYDFKLPEGLPDNFAYDKSFSDQVKGWMHDAGVHPLQAQKLHDQYVKFSATQAAEMQASEDKAVGDAHAYLVKTWGAPETETYKQNISYIDRAVSSKPGLLDAFKASGFLAADGAVKNAVVAETLAEWGKQLFAEDNVSKGDGKALSVNPFHKDTENLTVQGQLLRNDPQRARELITQAGREPKRWGL